MSSNLTFPIMDFQWISINISSISIYLSIYLSIYIYLLCCHDFHYFQMNHNRVQFLQSNMNLDHGLKRVKSLELLMRDSPSYNNSQTSSSYNQTPHEVSTFGSDFSTTLSTTQEDVVPPPPPPPSRTSYKTSHFETILQTQRHTELCSKIEMNHSNSKAVNTKLQNLEDKFNDMGVKLLSVEANLTLLSQAHAENNKTTNSLLRQLLDEMRSTNVTNNAIKTHEEMTQLTAQKKRKITLRDKKENKKAHTPEDDNFVDMADYLKLKHTSQPSSSFPHESHQVLLARELTAKDNNISDDELSDLTSSPPILHEREESNADDFIFYDV